MTQIAYLMRHATPDWTRTDLRYDLPPGPPLTDQGRAEARAAADFLRNCAISAIFASPLERTLTTAGIIAASLGLPVEVEPQLAEWREGEDETDVARRSLAYWESMWAARAGTQRGAWQPLLVTHGGPSRLLLQGLGLSEPVMEHFRAQFDHSNPMPPAGIWRLEKQADAWAMDLVYAPVAFEPYPHAA